VPLRSVGAAGCGDSSVDVAHRTPRRPHGENEIRRRFVTVQKFGSQPRSRILANPATRLVTNFRVLTKSYDAGRDSSRERSQAAVTAFMMPPRTPACSRACRPAMVVPPGLVTASFSDPGCC